MVDMQQHIRELKDMRKVCRETGHTQTSLAQRFGCRDQEVFDILEGRTKEGELRAKILAFLVPDDAPPAQSAAPDASALAIARAAGLHVTTPEKQPQAA